MASSHCIFINFGGLLLVLDLGLDDFVIEGGSELGQDTRLLNRECVCALERVLFAGVHVAELNACDCEGAS